MEEKMNLSDFTKDGSPVVEQKQEEDAIEEQSTDEVSIRNESETSGEVPQENEEVVEESTEQSEEEVKEEEAQSDSSQLNLASKLQPIISQKESKLQMQPTPNPLASKQRA